MDRRFDISEITTLDVLPHIRSNPNMYWTEATKLASGLVEEALLLGCADVRVTRLADLWIVMADEDWLKAADVAPELLFERIRPFTRGGPNSMWIEVVLTAYCSDVATWTPEAEQVIRGDRDTWTDIVGQTRARHATMRRYIAFTSPREPPPQP